MSKDKSIRTSLRIRIGLSMVTFVLALLVLEVIARGLSIDFNPNPYWRFESTLGWTQEKSMSFEGNIDGDPVRVEFNRMGFRDIDHEVNKPEGTRRIVVLGDSFSEASQVNMDETYWHRLESLLDVAGTGDWEVINLGVGDFGNAQAWLALNEYGLEFSPDIVLFQLFPLNDICNNTIELAGLCKSQNDRYRPYFVETEEGLQITRTQPIRHRLRSALVTFGVLDRVYRTLAEQWQSESVDELHLRRTNERGFPGDPLLYTFVETSQQIEPIAKGWAITEMILEMTGDLLEQRGIAWLPVVIPFEARLGPRWSGFAAASPQMAMVSDYPETRLGDLFERMGVPPVFLKPVFEENLDIVLPTRGGHLNPDAHALAADAIFETMLEAGMLN
jgi:hypothetical protein